MKFEDMYFSKSKKINTKSEEYLECLIEWQNSGNYTSMIRGDHTVDDIPNSEISNYHSMDLYHGGKYTYYPVLQKQKFIAFSLETLPEPKVLFETYPRITHVCKDGFVLKVGGFVDFESALRIDIGLYTTEWGLAFDKSLIEAPL